MFDLSSLSKEEIRHLLRHHKDELPEGADFELALESLDRPDPDAPPWSKQFKDMLGRTYVEGIAAGRSRSDPLDHDDDAECDLLPKYLTNEYLRRLKGILRSQRDPDEEPPEWIKTLLRNNLEDIIEANGVIENDPDGSDG